MDSMEMVDVLLAGTLLPDADLDRAVEALVRLSGITPEQARILVTSGKPRLVKRNLTPEAGKNLMDRLGAMGIKTIMRPATGPHNTVPASTASPPQSVAPPAPGPDELPRTAKGPEREARPAVPAVRPEPEAGEHNPYAPPKASLVRKRVAAGEWRQRGRVVPAGHGFKWIRDAWTLFRERPGAWCGMTLLYGICVFAVGLVPLAGGLAQAFLGPVFSGGIALAAHEQKEGGAIGVGRLFGGFGPRFGQLALIGVLLLLGALVLGIAAVALVGGQIFVALKSGNPDPALLEPIAGRLLLILPLFLLWFAPMMLAMLFAPTLVAAGGHGARQAVLASIGAGLRNWRAGLVNFIGLAGFGLAAGVVVGLIAAVLGVVVGRDNAGILIVLFPLLWALICLPLSATCFIMSYTATRDIFHDGDDVG